MGPKPVLSVRTPAYFCTSYSIKFHVRAKGITLYGINRHEFRIIGQNQFPACPVIPRSIGTPTAHAG
jgi:hypothetical protein